MKQVLPAIFTILGLSLFLHISHAQSCRDASVELSAVVQSNPPRITLNWVPNASATKHFVYRKLKTISSWGVVIGNLPGSATQFVDTTVQVGTSYEYRVFRQATSFEGYGYINAGIEVPVVEDRGTIILVVDHTHADSLVNEIGRLEEDFQGDGWKVKRLIMSRDSSAAYTKAQIKAVYDQDPTRVKALCLLGRVPVPYSGDIFPDGHPDHEGAWPADVYYADMNGFWTDNTVNVTVATDERHRNVPGDGKFDQSLIPGDLELQVGRIDFSNMPAFAASELELLRNYLNKDHAYRHKEIRPVYRGLVDDNFGFFGAEAFAASGWKNFGPLVNTANVMSNDYFSTLADSSYLWSYGCGGGWYQGSDGIGTTDQFAGSNTKSVFTMLFGSYFGDWDSQNNFLRAPLAQGQTLTNVWSGRPHWILHHMALGEPIGYSARVTQNNSSTYYASYGARFVHIALMGDPTLRNDVVAPVTNLTAEPTVTGALISWDPSPDPVLGYYVYVKNELNPDFSRLHDAPIQDLYYDFECVSLPNKYTFMVRAITLQESASGTYYNLSQGIMKSVTLQAAPIVTAEASYMITGSEVSFTNLSINADTYHWDFGDGATSTEANPVHAYSDGLFTVTLIAGNACNTDTFLFDVTILTDLDIVRDDPSIVVSPNPSDGKFSIHFLENNVDKADVTVCSATGVVVFEKSGFTPTNEIDLTTQPSGMYTLIISRNGVRSLKKIAVSR